MSFNTSTITINCPDCGKEHKKPADWVRDNTQLDCPCGTVLHFDPKVLLKAAKKTGGGFSKGKSSFKR